MNIEIPPIPTIYNMVNLDGFDLSTASGIVVSGIYDKVRYALSEDKIEIFYNWKFADVVLPPSYVRIDDSTLGELIVNEEILITSQDRVSIIGISRPPVINSILITENGTYQVEAGVDGYSPVIVEVPEPPPPTLVSLSVTANGQYLPGEGEDGFSEVNVAVPVPLPYDSTPEENGTGNPGASGQWARGDHAHPITIEYQNAVIPSGVSGLAFRDNSDNSKIVIKHGRLVIVNISLRAQNFTFTVAGEASAWNTMIELPWPASVIPWFVGTVGLQEDGASTPFVDIHGVNVNNKLCLTIYGNRTMRAVNRSFSFNFCYLTN